LGREFLKVPKRQGIETFGPKSAFYHGEHLTEAFEQTSVVSVCVNGQALGSRKRA
jgi:hypothetical protein